MVGSKVGINRSKLTSISCPLKLLSSPNTSGPLTARTTPTNANCKPKVALMLLLCLDGLAAGQHAFAIVDTSYVNSTCKKIIMKILASLLVTTLLAFAIAPGAHAQKNSADSSAVQANLKEMEDAWVKALVSKDSAAIGNFIADDFAGFNPEGKRVTKSQLLDEAKNEPATLSSSANENMDVHVYGPNLAAVSGITNEKGKDKNGKQFTRSYIWVDTWMERDGKWQCIAEGVMELPKKK